MVRAEQSLVPASSAVLITARRSRGRVWLVVGGFVAWTLAAFAFLPHVVAAFLVPGVDGFALAMTRLARRARRRFMEKLAAAASLPDLDEATREIDKIEATGVDPDAAYLVPVARAAVATRREDHAEALVLLDRALALAQAARIDPPPFLLEVRQRALERLGHSGDAASDP